MRNIAINKTIKILLFFLFTISTAEGLYGPLLGLFVKDAIPGATFKTLGFAVAYYAVTKSIIQIPLAHYLDKTIGERRGFFVMMLGAAIGATQTFGFLFIKTPLHFYLLSVLSGVGAACLMASYYGIFSRHVDKHSQGLEWSLFSVGGLTVSAALGAAVGGVLTDTFGFYKTFLTAGICELSALIILLAVYPFLNTKVEKIKD